MACSVGAVVLAALMAGLVPDARASTLNTTDDGLSVAGIFFAKVETFHAKMMSGDVGMVRFWALFQCTCFLLMFRFTPLQNNQTFCQKKWEIEHHTRR
jgi:hypothetical protein